jgi:hypothetical protein
VTTTRGPTGPETAADSLDALIAAYVQAVEAGAVPNRQDLLDRHPEHSDAMRAFFADLDRMDRAAALLRLDTAADPDATGSVADPGLDGPDVRPRVRYFGDYELLEEIAHGGMGIVYKARQVSLNRIVALKKMVLAGTFATPREVARFRAEAEAAANLDHPHIVPIFEVGEHEGQQYFSMKYVEGTSLARHPRGTLREEVAGLVDVARAVHHAHQHMVLHRELKPSNVLVDPRGVRFVTDFGLAKRLAEADASLTEPGQVLGTPKYMAPEQAAGRKDLTVAADVYSLGVILYERITGQAPFVGEDVLTILRQVREAEPPRPSAVMAGIHLDLETVVLKCLEKDPARRYASAEALADDLDRWLEGRPIMARPVATTERVWRWVRRNPALAAAGGLAVVGILVALSTSIALALQYRARAAAERKRLEVTLKAEKAAMAARDSLEVAYARSLIAPLDLEGSDLKEPQMRSLWELAGLESDRVRLRFLDEAVRDPITARQLRNNADAAVTAAVGLDPRRRDQAAGLLLRRLRNPALPVPQQVETALIALNFVDRPDPLAREAARVLIAGLESGQADPAFSAWNNVLAKHAEAWEPQTLSGIFSVATSHWHDWRGPAEGLVAVAGRVDPDEAVRVLDETLRQDGLAPGIRLLLVRGLILQARRLEPAAARRVYARCLPVLSRVVADETAQPQTDRLGQLLASIGKDLDPSHAAEVAPGMVRTLRNLFVRILKPEIVAGDPLDDLGSPVQRYQRIDQLSEELAWALGPFADHLGPVEAARACEPSADLLERQALTRGLAALSIQLAPERAVAAARRVAQAVNAETQPEQGLAVEVYILLVHLLDRSDAQRAARLLVAAIGKENDNSIRQTLAAGLCLVAGAMAPADAAEVCRPAAFAMREVMTSKDPKIRRNRTYFVEGFIRAAAGWEVAQARQEAKVLMTSLGQEGFESFGVYVRCLGSVGCRLPPAERSLLAGRILERYRYLDATDVTYENEHADLVRAVSVLDEDWKSAEARSLLILRFEHGLVPDSRAKLAPNIRSAARRLDPAKAADLLRPAFEIETATGARRELVAGLLETANRLPVPQATRLRSLAVPALLEEGAQLELLGTTMLPHLSPKQAHDIAWEIVATIAARYSAWWKAPSWWEAPGTLRVLLLDPETNPRAAARSRLTAAELVELLKMPTCHSQLRRAILGCLGDHYGRRFANHWDFVIYAQEHHLNLDFTTPPRRPDPKGLTERILRILDEPSGEKAPRVSSRPRGISTDYPGRAPGSSGGRRGSAMSKLTDPVILDCHHNAMANWRLEGFVVFKEQAAEWLRRELGG